MYDLCFTASFRFDGLYRVRIAIFLLEKVSWFFECIKVRATSMTPPTKWWFLSIDRSSTKWWFPSYLALRILLNCSRSTKEHFTLPRSRETSFSRSFSSEKASASWSLQTNRWGYSCMRDALRMDLRNIGVDPSNHRFHSFGRCLCFSMVFWVGSC